MPCWADSLVQDQIIRLQLRNSIYYHEGASVNRVIEVEISYYLKSLNILVYAKKDMLKT